MSWYVFVSLAWLIFYFAPSKAWRRAGLAALLLFLFLGLGSGRR